MAQFRYFTQRCILEISVSHASKLYKTHPYSKRLVNVSSDNQKEPKFRPFAKITNDILKSKIFSRYLNRTSEFSFQQCIMESNVGHIHIGC